MVEHQKGYRRMWMFPRNIRKIHPWKISQFLSIFNELQNEFGEWEGNVEMQRSFSQSLQTAGLKEGTFQRDENSGGPRTYLAQIKSLGLIYRSANNGIDFTIAGDTILNGNPPLPVLQTQLIRYQYPSLYSLGSQVRIHPDIKIKPFHFILKMISHFGTLSETEMIVPVILGHENDDLNDCIRIVDDMRAQDPKSVLFAIVKRDPFLLSTPRSIVDENTTDETLLSKLDENAKDIANTFKNCLEACLLIEPVTGSPGHYAISSQALNLLNDFEEEFSYFMPNPGNEEKFQREFGRFNRTRDNRRVDNIQPKINAEKELIKRLIRAEQNSNPDAFDLQSFANQCEKNYGLKPQKLIEVATESAIQLFGEFEGSFLELACGGTKTATKFEITITRLLNEKNIPSKHIGNKRRTREVRGAYADVLVELEDHCGLIDAKAYQKYPLPADDYHSVVNNYVKNFRELTEKERLGFFAFISTEFTPTVPAALLEIQRETGVPATAITASAFINLYTRYMKEQITKDEFLKYFYTGRVVRISDI